MNRVFVGLFQFKQHFILEGIFEITCQYFVKFVNAKVANRNYFHGLLPNF